MTPLLRAQKLSIGIRKSGGISAAVEDISFQVGKGEIVGLVGESGCGKTLTALSIIGLLGRNVSVTGGTLMFDGSELTALSEREKRCLRGYEISMVFQEPMTALDPLMKIGAQVAEPLRLHRITDAQLVRGRVLEALRQAELSEPERLMGAYPHQLSGGMRQRVMIAAAVVGRPKLLIADEATTALDVTVQAQILQLLKRLNGETGVSILFISHDLGVIRSICDRVIVMYAGRIVERGPAADVFHRPAHEYTKGLLGSIATPEKKGRPLASIPGRVPAVTEKKPGCPFAPRCARVQDVCFREFPGELPLGDGHSVNCALVERDRGVEYGRI